MQRIQDAVTPARGGSIANSFWRLGWAGFWIQIVLGSLPIMVTVYYLAFSRAGPNAPRGLAFVQYLTIANMLVLVFTIFWSYRYTHMAKLIKDPQRRPMESSVTKSAWTGVVAGTIGMLFSAIVLLVEAAALLFYFLKAPQAGMPVIQTSGAEAIHWVSTIDVLSIVALVLMLIAQLFVLVFSLWLLFRTTVSSSEYPKLAD